MVRLLRHAPTHASSAFFSKVYSSRRTRTSVRHGRTPTYASVYNSFFKVYSLSALPSKQPDVVSWVRNELAASPTLVHSMKWSRHMLSIVRTQGCGMRLPLAVRTNVCTQHRLLTLRWTITRLRPLQRRILEYLWRPGGPMFQRLCRDATKLPMCMCKCDT